MKGIRARESRYWRIASSCYGSGYLFGTFSLFLLTRYRILHLAQYSPDIRPEHGRGRRYRIWVIVVLAPENTTVRTIHGMEGCHCLLDPGGFNAYFTSCRGFFNTLNFMGHLLEQNSHRFPLDCILRYFIN